MNLKHLKTFERFKVNESDNNDKIGIDWQSTFTSNKKDEITNEFNANDTTVSFDIAKLAKAAGFNKPCKKYYMGSGKLYLFEEKPLNHNDDSISKEKYSAPTQKQLQDWVKKELKIDIIIDHFTDQPVDDEVWSDCYQYFINGEAFQPYYKTYENALEAALINILEKHDIKGLVINLDDKPNLTESTETKISISDAKNAAKKDGGISYIKGVFYDKNGNKMKPVLFDNKIHFKKTNESNGTSKYIKNKISGKKEEIKKIRTNGTVELVSGGIIPKSEIDLNWVYIEYSTKKYAGQKKVSDDIDRKLKQEQSRTKSNAKKAEQNKMFYYAKLLNKNKTNESSNKLGLDPEFSELVYKLEELNKGLNTIDIPKSIQDKINAIGKKIKDKGLIDKCEDKYFAKQLLMKNEVPSEYYK